MEFNLLDAREAVRIAAGALLPLAEAKKVSLQTDVPDADIRIEADLELLKAVAAPPWRERGQVHRARRGRSGSCARRTVPRACRHRERLGHREKNSREPARAHLRALLPGGQSLVRRFGGTWLGLALCKSIVEVHGGSIAVESAVGDGSTFTVRLPRRAPQRAQGTEALPVAPGTPTRRSGCCSR